MSAAEGRKEGRKENGKKMERQRKEREKGHKTEVAVITGGGSGMGLEAAKHMPKRKVLVLAERDEQLFLNKMIKKCWLEKEEGGDLIPFTAEKRMGKPEELGFAIAAAADERNGYLAGVDILCDGGSVRGKEFRRNK